MLCNNYSDKKQEWKQKALKLENTIQKIKNKMNHKTVIEGHTVINTKMWRDHNIHLGQNISIEELEEIFSSSDAGKGKMSLT